MVSRQGQNVIQLFEETTVTADPLVQDRMPQDQTDEVGSGGSFNIADNEKIIQLLDMVKRMPDHLLEMLLGIIGGDFFEVSAQATTDDEVMSIQIETEPVIDQDKHQKNIDQLMSLKMIHPETGDDMIVTEE